MPSPSRAVNAEVYNAPEVAAHYADLNYLTPCEGLLFQSYVRPGMAVLDLGVGGGRTAAALSAVASRYVGVDSAAEMIKRCRAKFPDLQFCLADAANLADFADSSFDAVVIAFNGLDYVVPDENRCRCLAHCHRILTPQGILIFSSHNPRSVFVRPAWNPQRVRSLAERLAGGTGVSIRLLAPVLILARMLHAWIRAAWASIARLARRLPTVAFWHGDGYFLEADHGGLLTHCAEPSCVTAELERLDFRLVEILGDDYPRKSHPYVTDWYYYVFVKTPDRLPGAECCA